MSFSKKKSRIERIPITEINYRTFSRREEVSRGHEKLQGTATEPEKIEKSNKL